MINDKHTERVLRAAYPGTVSAEKLRKMRVEEDIPLYDAMEILKTEAGQITTSNFLEVIESLCHQVSQLTGEVIELRKELDQK